MKRRRAVRKSASNGEKDGAEEDVALNRITVETEDQCTGGGDQTADQRDHPASGKLSLLTFLL